MDRETALTYQLDAPIEETLDRLLTVFDEHERQQLTARLDENGPLFEVPASASLEPLFVDIRRNIDAKDDLISLENYGFISMKETDIPRRYQISFTSAGTLRALHYRLPENEEEKRLKRVKRYDTRDRRREQRERNSGRLLAILGILLAFITSIPVLMDLGSMIDIRQWGLDAVEFFRRLLGGL